MSRDREQMADPSAAHDHLAKARQDAASRSRRKSDRERRPAGCSRSRRATIPST